MKLHSEFLVLLWCYIYHGASGADDMNKVSVKEGDPVTLHTGVQTNQQDSIRWYYNDIRIAQISADRSKSCTDVQCNEDTERFRDRLKLDHQTGSLTILHTRTEDSGEYTLMIGSSVTIFSVSVTGVSGAVDTDAVLVIEGDSVTLNTGVQSNQQDKIKWYYNDTRIAQINGDLSKSCTDVQCNEGTERFRDRLKLDHQTGSLTIMNITNTHSGEYKLRISSGSSDSENAFTVSVSGVPAAERDEVKRKTVNEGESVTLAPGLRKKVNYLLTWYFHDTLIAEITGDQSKICTDVQCKERFRDRLELDHQTGSLTITHTTTEHTGVYKLLMNSSRFSILKTFSVTVTVTDSVPSSAVIAGMSAAVAVLLLVTGGVIYYLYRRKRKMNGNRTQRGDHDQENDVGLPLTQTNGTAQTSHNETETASMANGTSSSVTRTNGISQ